MIFRLQCLPVACMKVCALSKHPQIRVMFIEILTEWQTAWIRIIRRITRRLIRIQAVCIWHHGAISRQAQNMYIPSIAFNLYYSTNPIVRPFTQIDLCRRFD